MKPVGRATTPNAQSPVRHRWLGAREEERGVADWVANGVAVEAELAWVRYAAPAVIFGRRGGITAERQARAATLGCTLHERQTGGGAVLAGPWMVGLHLWLPTAHPLAAMGTIPCMRWLGETLRGGLELVDVSTRLADADAMADFKARAAQAGVEWACFAGLSHGELLDASGRKCLGIAQARKQAGVLLSAGLLTGPTPWQVLEGVHQGHAPARSALADLVSDGCLSVRAPDPEDWRETLEGHLRAALAELGPVPAGGYAEAFETRRTAPVPACRQPALMEE